VELPIVPTSTGPLTGSGDADISFEDDAHEPQVLILAYFFPSKETNPLAFVVN